MISPIWVRRAAAVVILLCGLLSAGALAKTAGAWREVDRSARELTALQADPPSRASWSAPRPILRTGAASVETAVETALRRSLSIGEPTIVVGAARPLGGGLKLAEATLEVAGDARTAETLAQWGAVNRDSLRLSELKVVAASDGTSRVTARLLAVIA